MGSGLEAGVCLLAQGPAEVGIAVVVFFLVWSSQMERKNMCTCISHFLHGSFSGKHPSSVYYIGLCGFHHNGLMAYFV